MFTGLIDDVGKIEAVSRTTTGLELRLSCRYDDLVDGESIAVNGACLTIVDRDAGSFTVDVSPETLQRTNFRSLRRGDIVNLERPLRLSDRLGGHLVTGHIDGVGIAEKIRKTGKFIYYTFRVPPHLELQLVPKGSVAVDGISLTVNECEDRRFSVAVIPFTLKHTNLRDLRVGDKVNIETDLIGKYVQRLLHPSGR